MFRSEERVIISIGGADARKLFENLRQYERSKRVPILQQDQ